MGSLNGKSTLSCVAFLSLLSVVFEQQRLHGQEDDLVHTVECDRLPDSLSLNEFISQLGDHQLVFAKKNPQFYTVFMKAENGDMLFAVVDPIHQHDDDPERSGSVRIAYGKVGNRKVAMTEVGESRTVFLVDGQKHSRHNGWVYRNRHKLREIDVGISSGTTTESYKVKFADGDFTIVESKNE